MIVIIAEKPSLARSVAKVIGIINEHKTAGYIECRNSYTVTWVFGHILELAEPQAYDDKYQRWNLADLPIRPNNWQLIVKKEAEGQYKNIQTLLQQASSVVNCGDPDREGQLLVDEVLLHLQCNKPTKRLLILDPKDTAIRTALDNMEDNSKYYSWYQAGLLRSQADWLIGMNFTRAFTNLSRSYGGEGVTSVGRVQTPTLKLIYDRDLAISNFKPLSYYNLLGLFSNQAGQQFIAKLDYSGLGFCLDAQGRLLNAKALQSICDEIKQQDGVITKYETRACETPPPLTFKLSDLQALANSKLGYSVDETLQLAQKLYEKQLTTYPRSACSYLPESMHADGKNTLTALAPMFSAALKADSKLKSRAFNDKQLGGEAHFAIIPTGNILGVKGLQAKELALYQLIVMQYIAQFYPNMHYEQTDGVVQVQELYNFKFSGRVTRSLGWKELFTQEKTAIDATPDSEESQILPPLQLNEAVQQIKLEIKQTTTKKPKAYTEGSLVKTMTNIHNELENIVKSYYSDPTQVADMVLRYKKVLKDTAGLGTEATRSNIIKTLKLRNFIELNAKNIQITAKGRSFMQLLTANENLLNFSMLTSPLTTAIYEQQLEDILNHRFTAEQFNKNLDDLLHSKLDIIKHLMPNYKAASAIKATLTGEKCPECKADLVLRMGKFGKFKSCSNYPKCKYTPLKEPKADQADKPEKCPKCGLDMLKRTAKTSGNMFLGCSGYPKCDFVKW